MVGDLHNRIAAVKQRRNIYGSYKCRGQLKGVLALLKGQQWLCGVVVMANGTSAPCGLASPKCLTTRANGVLYLRQRPMDLDRTDLEDNNSGDANLWCSLVHGDGYKIGRCRTHASLDFGRAIPTVHYIGI